MRSLPLCVLLAASAPTASSLRFGRPPAPRLQFCGAKPASAPPPPVRDFDTPAAWVLLRLRGGGLAASLSKPSGALGVLSVITSLLCVSAVTLFLTVFRAQFSLGGSKGGQYDRAWRALRWDELRDELRDDGTERVTDGAASEHAHAARNEAARLLSHNHEMVLADIVAPTPAPTQPMLARLPGQEKHVDAALHEVARRLVGRRPSERELRVQPSSKAQAAAWAATSEYLSARIQSAPISTPGFEQRAPDMSEAAAAAMRAVLAEVGSATSAEAAPVGAYAKAGKAVPPLGVEGARLAV